MFYVVAMRRFFLKNDVFNVNFNKNNECYNKKHIYFKPDSLNCEINIVHSDFYLP